MKYWYNSEVFPLAPSFTININGKFCFDLLKFVLTLEFWEYFIPEKAKCTYQKTQFASQSGLHNAFPNKIETQLHRQ